MKRSMRFIGAPCWRVWLLGAVAIILFSVLYLPRLIGGSSKPLGRYSAARRQVRIFEKALDIFHREVGRYPTGEEGFEALIGCPPGLDPSVWKGPYLVARTPPRDPWGNEYVYVRTGDSLGYKVISLGRDGVSGTEDDIASASKTTAQ
jgi:general secretion pathway protein G